MAPIRTHVASLLAATSLLSAAAAQDSWRLPERGVASFERSLELRTEIVDPPDARRAPNPDLGIFRYRQLNPPLLFQSELDRRQQHRAAPPADLRDLASQVALDLEHGEKGGKLRYVAPCILPFGDIQVTGKAPAADASGRQVFELDVVRVAPDRGRERRDVFEAFIAQACRHELTGKLAIERQLDRETGVVRSFTSTLSAAITFPAGDPIRSARFVLVENWKLAKVHEPRDVDFRTGVDDGIRRATAWLKGRLVDPTRGELAAGQDPEQRTYDSGRLALVLLALLKAEVDPEDPVLRAGFAELLKRELIDTYALSIAIMALEARHAPLGERELLVAGAIDKPKPRALPAAERAVLQQWVERLLTNCDHRVAVDNVRRWGYVGGTSFDNSNSQYAALGLYSAHLCGVRVSDTVWRAMAAHWLGDQKDTKAPATGLRLTSLRELARMQDDRQRANTVAERRVQPAGWSYTDDGRPAYGAMTAAGVTALTLCEAVLRDGQKTSPAVLASIDNAIRAGLGWLAVQFSTRCNTGFPPEWHNRRYYYLHALERACEMSQVALLQERDWYHEGALMLLGWQLQSGEFAGDVHTYTGALDNTAFGLLFLKKGVLPVFTGKR